MSISLDRKGLSDWEESKMEKIPCKFQRNFFCCESDDIRGVQLSGLGNMADEIHGVQGSLGFNLANKLRGLQMTLYGNYCGEDSKGIQVGLINYREGGNWYSKFSPIIAIRTGRKKSNLL
jgi:hypothetical protein|tara:strand:+ start:210 stop:569 length:360 start_codon:yes stop_codon:yes gene_type:complete